MLGVTRAGLLLRSLPVWVAWALMLAAWTVVVLVVLILTGWWDRQRRITSRVFQFSAQLGVWLNPYWTVTYSGTYPTRADHPFVAVSNHESLADPIALGPLPWTMKWLSKESNFRIPFIGWMLWLAGNVKVRRGDPESRAAAFVRLRRSLDAGMSVMILPEGTRSKTGDMLPFHNGAFRLALEAGVPVLPIVIRGARDALVPRTAYFRRAHIQVAVLDMVPVDGLDMSDLETLRDGVRDLIISHRA